MVSPPSTASLGAIIANKIGIFSDLSSTPAVNKTDCKRWTYAVRIGINSLAKLLFKSHKLCVLPHSRKKRSRYKSNTTMKVSIKKKWDLVWVSYNFVLPKRYGSVNEFIC